MNTNITSIWASLNLSKASSLLHLSKLDSHLRDNHLDLGSLLLQPQEAKLDLSLT